MADVHLPSDANAEANVVPDRVVIAGPPRWVKVFGAVALILVLMVVVVHLSGGGLGNHLSMP